MAEQDGEDLTMEHIISVVLVDPAVDEMWLSKAGEI
ncbi:hypothetical protein C7N77_07995 [Aeromonas rivipollensis]|nr:hypothetical protein C7N77_07995 [Aeromonas rivipollensis]HCH52769.1 hypothetical protein [Aeromonas sp.]